MIASCNSVNETHGVSSEYSGNTGTPTHATALSNNPSLKQQEVKICSPNEQGLSRASNVAFTSMPPMHINEHQMDPVGLQNMELHNGGVCSKSCSEPVGSSGTCANEVLFPSNQTGVSAQRNYYSPHWSNEAVEKALEVRTLVGFCLLKMSSCNNCYQITFVYLFIFFPCRRVKFLKPCFMSMLTIDSRFLTFYN